MKGTHAITDFNLDREQAHLFKDNHSDEYGNEITQIEVDGNWMHVCETEIIDQDGYTAMKLTTIDGRAFSAPIQGYNELSGDFWSIEWKHMIELTEPPQTRTK